MRIGVVGDTHGNLDKLILAVQRMGSIDLLLFTGDHYRDILRAELPEKLKVKAVRGNCDLEGPDHELIEAEDHKILLLHGHQYGVKGSLNSLVYRAQELGADIVVFGHTHIPEIEREDGILIFNPGSAARPRGASFYPTYGILTLSEGGTYAHIEELRQDNGK
ncbi:MAG TPA: metallophosphoesterase [Bacillota bacterium]|nr:metallophosphoesterase [Bacillota bacterium]